ncbi:MAG: hypothetical protein GF409_01110 [Candidatus Omnitrophica bacterium]|nr:hypothetical protein [Candidatus Omnitrophota bacterium]
MIAGAKFILAGLFIGAVIGLGLSMACRVFLGGVCPLTSDPVTSSLLGALIGSSVSAVISVNKGR